MINKIFYNDFVSCKIQKGISRVSKILSLTLGPRGKSIVIWNKDDKPLVLNDGITIVGMVNSVDFIEDSGQFLLKDIISKVNDTVGDGTSTTGVISGNLISKGISIINSGFNPNLFSNGITRGSNFFLKNMYKIAWPLNNNRDILKIATNSAGGDFKVGKILVKAFQKVGTDGLVTIETANSKGISLVIYGGLQIDRGYVSHKFINNFKESSCEFSDCKILITDLSIKSTRDVIKILQIAMEANKPFLIISDEISKKPLQTLITNNIKLNVNICAIKMPSFGNYRKSVLQDIAIATGGQYITKESGFKLKDLSYDKLGSLKRCIITRNNSSFISKSKYKNDIRSRIHFLENLLLKTDSIYEIGNISERIAKLSGGVALIQVGASTEVELGDKKLRVEDAKNATFAALTKGVLSGSSVSLLHYSTFLNKYKSLITTMDEGLGVEILLKSLSLPNRSIIENSDENISKIERKIIENPIEIGFDSENKCISNLNREGILDPCLLIFNCLSISCKITGVIINAKAVISKRNINWNTVNFVASCNNILAPYIFSM